MSLDTITLFYLNMYVCNFTLHLRVIRDVDEMHHIKNLNMSDLYAAFSIALYVLNYIFTQLNNDQDKEVQSKYFFLIINPSFLGSCAL